MPENIQPRETRFWKTVWDSPTVRYFLLAPTVLSILVNVRDIGRLAHALILAWHPFLEWMQDWLVRHLPELPLNPRDEVVMLFFLPFVILGTVQRIRSRNDSVPALVAVGACMSFSLIISIMYDMWAPGRYPDGTLVATSSFLFFAIPAAGAFVGAAIRRWRRGRWEIPFIAMPIASLFLVMIACFDPAITDAWKMLKMFLVGLLVMTFPFFNPRRLLDVGVLVLGVIVLSYLSELVIGLAGKIGVPDLSIILVH